MDKQYFVYIMTTQRNSVFYTGVTRDLRRRVWQHQHKMVDGFTKRYNVIKLVYYEVFDNPYDAIVREKQIKGGSRAKKIGLINTLNPGWKDLSREPGFLLAR